MTLHMHAFRVKKTAAFNCLVVRCSSEEMILICHKGAQKVLSQKRAPCETSFNACGLLLVLTVGLQFHTTRKLRHALHFDKKERKEKKRKEKKKEQKT
jgi:hypothetical protein